MASEDEVRTVKRAHSARLLGTPGISGVAIERDEAGSYYLAIHLDTEADAPTAVRPDTLDGVPVRYHESGPFRKQGASGGASAPRKAKRASRRRRPEGPRDD